MIIYKNNEYIEEEKSFISTNSDAFNYGASFFETIKFENGKCEYLKEHLERLEKAVSLFETRKFNILEIEEIIEILYRENRLRENLYTVKIIYSPIDEVFIIEFKENRYKNLKDFKNFKVKYAKDRRNEQSRITYMKSSNYLANKINLMEVKKDGFDECIFLNTKKIVAEGSYTNIFFEKDGIFYTPQVKDGILPGIMREKFIEKLKGEGKEIVEGNIEENFYLECENVYLTNSLMGILKIKQFEEKIY